MTDDEFHAVQTMLRTFDVNPIARPDAEEAIRRGRHHRRIKDLDRVLAVAAMLVLLLGGGVTTMRVWHGGVAQPATVSPSATNTTTPTPTTALRSPRVSVASGGTVPVGDTGAVLRVTADGMCTEPAPGLSAAAANEIPTSCYDVTSNNYDLAASGWVGGDAGWASHTVYYGLTTSSATMVSVTESDGRTYLGTLASVPGEDWSAFFVITPFKPYTIDAEHPTPPAAGVLEVTDEAGESLRNTSVSPATSR